MRVGRSPLSAIEQPEYQRHDHTDDEARDDWEVEVECSALDHEVARKPAKPEPKKIEVKEEPPKQETKQAA